MTEVEHTIYLTDFERYLFHEGTFYDAYRKLGAHPENFDGTSGYVFRVWAPHAKHVSVIGSFNEWNNDATPMEKHDSVWSVFVPEIVEGVLYKYHIIGQDGSVQDKADPYAFFSELRPGTASVTCDLSEFRWTDGAFIKKKANKLPYENPMSIYEMHLGSWQTSEDGRMLSYGEVAERLIPYLKENKFTHVEFMPLSEFPFDGSWGYQVTGYFSATSRFGKPKDLMTLINKLHKADIGVILDWVPAHFPKDAHGLRRFDGSAVYEYDDPKIGEHKEWQTMVFDYGKPEVRSFLISNALFWLRVFHVDGLRVDAVSCMLYRNYNRKDGEWIANRYGGVENLEAVCLLQTLNEAVFKEFPNALMIAEESTAWPMVTHPTDKGGLGFNYKWNMGWMNDILRYFSMDPLFRKGNHNLITFSMYYAFSENFILPLSHDEVVHGKRSLIDKMPGTYEEKFANLRCLLAYMMAHPGKKLLFMGGEFAQFIEWRFYEGLEWMLKDYPAHRTFAGFTKALLEFYRAQKSLWQIENSWDGFTWINPNDCDRSTISFIRKGKAKSDQLIVVCNFTGVDRQDYVMGVPSAGTYEIVFSTDDEAFGGKTKEKTTIKATKQESDGLPYRLTFDLPGLSVLFLKKCKRNQNTGGNTYEKH